MSKDSPWYARKSTKLLGTQAFLVRVPPELCKKLTNIAKKQNISRNDLVTQVLAGWVSVREQLALKAIEGNAKIGE